MCLFKDYDQVARIKVMQWRLQYPNRRTPTISQLAVMLSDVPSRKREQVGIGIMHLTRR